MADKAAVDVWRGGEISMTIKVEKVERIEATAMHLPETEWWDGMM